MVASILLSSVVHVGGCACVCGNPSMNAKCFHSLQKWLTHTLWFTTAGNVKHLTVRSLVCERETEKEGRMRAREYMPGSKSINQCSAVEYQRTTGSLAAFWHLSKNIINYLFQMTGISIKIQLKLELTVLLVRSFCLFLTANFKWSHSLVKW